MSGTPSTLTANEWHGLRARNVGGSEVAALFGVQPDYAMSHYALWHVKAGKVPPPVVDNPRADAGLRLERAIAEWAAEQEAWKIEDAGYVTDPTTSGLGCTLDFIIRDHGETEYEGPGLLECKNTDWMVHRRSWVDGEPPLHILLQLQHQLACTGFAWGAVVCLVGGNDLRVYRYNARPKLIADIRRRVAAFWESIAQDQPPPVDGSDSAAAVLRAMYPETTDEIADLRDDNELPEICAGMLHASAKRRDAEKEEAEYKNRLIAKLGPHIAADCEGFRVRVAVTAAKEAAPAPHGYIIPGRKESRRYTIKEFAE